ncbi:hypothetical protein [Anaerobaca lacustris]|uniref:Tetratricopeptide repeat protein 38 n=1 Tax=Anaerobaca lacustris TaxID=3044600 RepID=A0AAW6U1F6_9BACT|nr:hypothetical protein [Sedimentisphaerales bacterium M17dextr]
MAAATDLIRRLRHKCNETEGELGYFGLGGWWSSAFTRVERDHIEASFHPSGLAAGAKPLTIGRGPSNYHSAAVLLTALAACLRDLPQDRHLASKVLAKAQERARAEDDVIGLHLVYQEMIRLHSKWRDQFPDALNLIFGACHKQVAMSEAAAQAFHSLRPHEALPAHLGYLTLAVLLEQEGSYRKAIEICRQARDQGWDGNWTWRIGSLARKRDEQDLGETYISRSGMGPV